MTTSPSAQFRRQAEWCVALGAPFTAALLRRIADDIAAGGPAAAFIEGHERRCFADALALRVMGAAHAAALAGRDPDLAKAYERAGEPGAAEAAWPALKAFLARAEPPARAFLDSPPQTNETARSLALLPGFLAAAEASTGPVRLLEIGASAGLNLCWDRFRYETPDWSWGPADGAVIAAHWSGLAPALGVEVRIAERAGCDVNPLDVNDADATLRLRAYIWAEQAERLARQVRAVEIARALNIEVEQADAADWLSDRLAAPTSASATIVFHSIMQQYMPDATKAAVEAAIRAAGERATVDAPLFWLRFESAGLVDEPGEGLLVDMVSWPGGAVRSLARADPHARAVESLL